MTVVGERRNQTLCKQILEKLICGLKEMTDKPVAVITKWGSAFRSSGPGGALPCGYGASNPLTLTIRKSQKKIDRPYGTIKFEEEFQGLKDFCAVYQGELWLEIMLVDGINDDKESIGHFKELLKELKYDRLYLNTPVRPPAEEGVNVVSDERMEYAVKELGGISIEMLSSGSFFSEIEDDYEAVKSIIGRHPMNQFELNGFLDKPRHRK